MSTGQVLNVRHSSSLFLSGAGIAGTHQHNLLEFSLGCFSCWFQDVFLWCSSFFMMSIFMEFCCSLLGLYRASHVSMRCVSTGTSLIYLDMPPPARFWVMQHSPCNNILSQPTNTVCAHTPLQTTFLAALESSQPPTCNGLYILPYLNSTTISNQT